MNINLSFINYILLFLIAMYVIQGVHKGFLMSLSATGGMTASWVIATAVTPNAFRSNCERIHIQLSALYDRCFRQSLFGGTWRALQSSRLSPQQIKDVVDYANLPVPFGDTLSHNMTGLAFASKGITTVADYLNYTVANITVNIISFLIIYILARVFITLIISSLYSASPFPVLKNFDGLVGGMLGGVRGFFAMYAVVLILPGNRSVHIPSGTFTNSLNQSVLLTFFYKTNFLYGFISGVSIVV